MKYLKSFFSLLVLLIISQQPIFSQTPSTSDTIRIVEILPGARKMELRKTDSITELQILVGNVRLKQGNTLFTCDSCVINNHLKIFEAFGRVHINEDTTDIYSDYLRYLIDKEVAYLKRKVRLTDGKGTLTTEELEYDLNTRIAIYKNGGKVVNKKTILTSKEGYYYSDIKDVYFKNNVELKNPSYYLLTDSLLYNTETETARFIAETFIKDSSKRTIVTREGYYNLKTGKAEFGQRPIIQDGKTRIIADRIAIDDSTGVSQAEGNAIIIDSVQGTTILAGRIFRNNKTESFLATRKPLMIIKQDEDSIYVSADTLFSARLSDLPAKDSIAIDTVKGKMIVNANQRDSTNRYFEAFRNVRIFSDSLQAVSDSLFYSFRDSTFRLYYEPVVWAKNSQISGDTILLFTKNKKADRLEVFENSFLVNRVEPEIYNQIKSSRMDGYFKEGAIDSVRAKGFAECIYYLQDEDSAFTGINQSESDIMDIYFSAGSGGKEKDLKKVVFRSAVKGTLWPIKHKTPGEMRLENFKWLDAKRPKTKFELFE